MGWNRNGSERGNPVDVFYKTAIEVLHLVLHLCVFWPSNHIEWLYTETLLQISGTVDVGIREAKPHEIKIQS